MSKEKGIVYASHGTGSRRERDGVGLGGEDEDGGGFACLARCQLTAQLDIVEHSEPCTTSSSPRTSQRVTLGLFPQ